MINNKQEYKGKEFTGKVLSAKMKDTVIVGVEVIKRHPVYKKATRKIRRFAVHSAGYKVEEGNTVKIRETKPASKTVHFTIIKVLEG